MFYNRILPKHPDRHLTIGADDVLVGSRFNDSDWRGERLKDDKRRSNRTPPTGNANPSYSSNRAH
ncbi:MAG: hypothetical protein ACREXM_11365 [Gammaproteobacteria bacterium]